MLENALIKDGLRWAGRREYLGENSIPCPHCKAEQVQLVDHVTSPAWWKCRICHHKFNFEPVAT